MKYKIEVSGRGCEAFIFKLSDEQRQRLWDSDVESGNMDHQEVCDILGIEDYFSTDDVLMGLYCGSNHGEYMWIKVIDELENTVWESSEDFNFGITEEQYKYDDSDYLVIEDYQKGHFFNYFLESESEFDPTLLSCVITELIGGITQQISEVKYNGQKLDREYVDTWSKGYNFYLS